MQKSEVEGMINICDFQLCLGCVPVLFECKA